MKKRILAMLLAALLVITTLPVVVLPASAQTEEETPEYLCFTAEAENSSVKLSSYAYQGMAPSVNLLYSVDGGVTWNIYDNTVISLPSVGDTVYLKADEPGNATLAYDENRYHFFEMTGKIAASGNLMTLLDADNPSETISGDYCFYSLFGECESLTTAPELPATTLSQGCYETMFYGCTNLRSTPKLPATTLAMNCYSYMFGHCTNLESPVYALYLPATDLPIACYSNMFRHSNVILTGERTEDVDNSYPVRFPAENDAIKVENGAFTTMFGHNTADGDVITPNKNTTYNCTHYSHLCADEAECIEGTDATCTTAGCKDCWKCTVCGQYYSDEVCENRISDLSAWAEPEGDGYIAPLGHDWDFLNDDVHQCAQCKMTESHADTDADGICDACEAVYTNFLDFNENTEKVDLRRTVWNANVIDDSEDAFVSGWNIVKASVEFEDRLVLPNDVNLILTDGATLTAKKGVTVAKDGDFAIYAQSTDKNTMGKLIVPEGIEYGCPGIGSADDVSGDIAVYGGSVTVHGGENAAGIGAGLMVGCGNITVYGGDLTALGGESAAGIGGGFMSSCGDITISGGTVDAQGGDNGGAGIGGGYSSSCGDITISGGTVDAQGGDDGGAGIGSGISDSSCTSITISGGTVTAVGGGPGAGIGSGYSASCGIITISGGTVTAECVLDGAGIGSGFVASCSGVTITGGYIKATAKENADPIGAGTVSDEVPIFIAESCTSFRNGSTQYINYEIPAKEPTCAESGFSAHYIDPVSEIYYTSFPYTPDGLIGDSDALATWKAQEGGGYIAPLGHDWIYGNAGMHTCTRCFVTEDHKDENEDAVCDSCGAVFVSYLDFDETSGLVDTERDIWVGNVIDDAADSFVSGWNVVQGNVTFENRITLPKNVKLILADGAVLTAQKGITVAPNGDFGIYAQSADAATMGKLIVPGAEAGNAGIGSVGNGTFVNVAIYGGMITVQGGVDAAGIGCGAADDEEVSEIGGNVTIKGGYIKATAGSANADPVGAGLLSGTVNVSIASACTSNIIDGVQYINYEIPTVEPTCTECGFLAYYIDPVSGNYYASLPFTAEGLIGGAEELAIWKSEDGDGYLAPHHIWESVNSSLHKCTRCEATEAHTGTEDDYTCDICGGVLLRTAKMDALMEILGAMGEDPSEELLEIVRPVTEGISSAETLEDIQTIKTNGLGAIAGYFENLAGAKTEAIEALTLAAGETPSPAVQVTLDTFCTKITAANSLRDIADIKESAHSLICAQVKAEAEAAAQKEAEISAYRNSLKASVSDTLVPNAKCDEAKGILQSALSLLDAALTPSEMDEIVLKAQNEANEIDNEFSKKLADYIKEISSAFGGSPSDETKKLAQELLDALNGATSIVALDEIFEENVEEVNFHAAKDNMLAEMLYLLETKDYSDAIKTILLDSMENLKAAQNMKELDAAYASGIKQVTLQQAREQYLAECEYVLASDEYSEKVKEMIRKFMNALNDAETLSEIEYMAYEYLSAVRLTIDRDAWLIKLSEIVPENPSDAVMAIIEDACELISFGEDSTIFDNVYDLARLAVQRQLTAEANLKALEEALKQAMDEIAAANNTIDNLGETIKNRDETLAEKQAEIDAVAKQLSEVKAELETAKGQLAELEELKEALEMELDTAQTGYNKLQTELESTAALLGESQLTIKDLQAEIERLEALLEDKPNDPSDPSDSDQTIGDVNGDGAVDMKDVLLMRKYLAALSEIDNAEDADVNGDGSTDMKDVLMLRKFLAGMIETLGVESK